jgi:hypothetical protein
MVEYEKSKILDNLPMVALIFVIILTYTPQIPFSFKFPILIIGIVGSIGTSFVTEQLLQFEASQFPALKSHISPIEKDVTFFIKEQLGEVPSKMIEPERVWYDEDENKHVVAAWYKTGPLELAVKVPFRTFGKVQKICIKHQRPWNDRIKGHVGTVIYKGLQIKHNSIANINLWMLPNETPNIDMLDVIPTFTLASAPQDFWLLKGKTYQDIGDLSQGD